MTKAKDKKLKKSDFIQNFSNLLHRKNLLSQQRIHVCNDVHKCFCCLLRRQNLLDLKKLKMNLNQQFCNFTIYTLDVASSEFILVLNWTHMSGIIHFKMQ